MKFIRDMLSTILMFLGAIFFFTSLVPVLNPAKFESAAKQAPVVTTLLTLIGFVVMALASTRKSK